MYRAIVFLDTEPGSRANAAVAAFRTVAGKLGLPFAASSHVLTAPAPVVSDLPAAVVAVNRAACEPHLGSLPPQWVTQIEYWDVPATFDPAAVETLVAGLVARLLGGRVADDTPPPPAKQAPKKVHTVRVGRETAGRKGKGVTTVFDLPLTEDGVKELATILKQKCGTGGTAKDGRIEIQGDHRDRITAELEKLGYKVKRSGG